MAALRLEQYLGRLPSTCVSNLAPKSLRGVMRRAGYDPQLEPRSQTQRVVREVMGHFVRTNKKAALFAKAKGDAQFAQMLQKMRLPALPARPPPPAVGGVAVVEKRPPQVRRGRVRWAAEQPSVWNAAEFRRRRAVLKHELKLLQTQRPNDGGRAERKFCRLWHFTVKLLQQWGAKGTLHNSAPLFVDIALMINGLPRRTLSLQEFDAQQQHYRQRFSERLRAQVTRGAGAGAGQAGGADSRGLSREPPCVGDGRVDGVP